MVWRAVLAGVALLSTAWIGGANAQSLERSKVTIASGGRALFAYLPMNIADTLGYFKDEGLSVEIPEFEGGSKVTQALVGGSADFANTVFDQTIRLQARNQDIKAVVAGTNYAYYVLLLPKERAEAYRSPADLKGLRIGVTAPGSGSHVLVDLLMAKVGLSSKNASIIQVGGGSGSISSMERGEIDALSSLDPVISRLEATGRFIGVVDTRTAKGMRDVYGGDYLSACLLARADFIAKNPNTVQAVVNAHVRAIRWLGKAKPEEVMAALPDKWIGPDKELFKTSVAKALEGVSKDGLMSDEAVNNVYKSLVSFDENVAKAKELNLTTTRDNSFVMKALERYH